MLYLLAIPAFALVAGAAYLSSLPAELAVKRSLRMNADRRQVLERIRDFRNWHEWSPWLIHEPEARVDFSDRYDQEGGTYSWDGARIGAGSLTHVHFEDGTRIEQRLEFTRPFKSTNEVVWEFADAHDGGTEVTWSMRGRVPFLVRPLLPLMQSAVEKDYELGLAMLRGVLDPGAERPAIRFLGPTERAPMTALTILFKGSMEDMVKTMEEGFPRLVSHVRSVGREPAGPPFTAYWKVDSKARHFECDMALPVARDCPPGDLTVREIPGGRFLTVELLGSYDFLPAAWHSAMAHLRMLKLKLDKGRPSLEVYENDPSAVGHSNEIRTRLDIPIR